MKAYRSPTTIASHTLRRLVSYLASCSLLIAFSGCFYVEAGAGQLALLNRQVPLARAIAGEQDLDRAALLLAVPNILNFAHNVVGMESGRCYRGYVDLGEEGLTHVLVASQQTRFEPYQWWFPLAGTVDYKSFFSKAHAESEAAILAEDGYDTYVAQSRAYSTLGYLRDPIVSSMLKHGLPGLVEVLLHELAHRRLYVPGQTDFNEQLASFVARKAGDQYFGQDRPSETALGNAMATAWSNYNISWVLQRRLIADTYEALQTLYDSPTPQREILVQRELHFERLRAALEAISIPGSSPVAPFNNARLMQFARYESAAEELDQIFTGCGQHWPCFWHHIEKYAVTLAEKAQAGDSPPK